jgi:hypothetical protein
VTGFLRAYGNALEIGRRHRYEAWQNSGRYPDTLSTTWISRHPPKTGSTHRARAGSSPGTEAPGRLSRRKRASAARIWPHSRRSTRPSSRRRRPRRSHCPLRGGTRDSGVGSGCPAL